MKASKGHRESLDAKVAKAAKDFKDIRGTDGRTD